ncbi:hypothetical protein PO909_031906, partial [Leuciscus waleckii]
LCVVTQLRHGVVLGISAWHAKIRAVESGLILPVTPVAECELKQNCWVRDVRL